MQVSPFHLPLDEHPAFVRQETDTATPHTPLPIYYIHALPTPFCTNPLCICQRGRNEAARLLGDVAEGSFVLRNAAALMEKREAAMSTTPKTLQQTRTEIHVDLISGVPEACQLLGHSWQETEHYSVKECALCHLRGYCPGCTSIPIHNAQAFFCTRHTPGI